MYKKNFAKIVGNVEKILEAAIPNGSPGVEKSVF